MSFRIISALVMRYVYLYTRTPMRLVELVFWPMVDLLIWGNVSISIKATASGALEQRGLALIGGTILWDVVFRAQQGVAVSFLEDVWTRNLLNVFVAPVRSSEYLIATFAVGILRICVTVVVMCLVALLVYGFNILSLGLPLVPFVFNLLLTGWALGMISTALILRWGQAAESLAWAIPFFIQPISAVFYPVSSIRPEWQQSVAWALPTTSVFEGMREVMEKHTFNWGLFMNATLLNIALMCLAGWIFAYMLSLTKKRGLLTKFATQ